MTYDADGLRSKRTDGSNIYLYYYDGGLLRCMEYNGVKMFFTYDAQGMPVSMTYNGNIYFYVLNLQGDVMALLDSSGNEVVSYHYNAWGKLIDTTASTTGMLYSLALYNPLRYRGYVYDRETGLYYASSRYYNPEICRWINADAYLSTGQGVLGYNMLAYCLNNPVNMGDFTGQWPKWVSGALNAISGTAQMIAGAALGATASWTGVGAVAAGFLLVNGAATATQGIGQIVNHVSDSNLLREDNIVRTGVQEAGRAIGGDTGAAIARGTYDVATVAANLYAGKVALQQAGVLPIKVNIDCLVDNPTDEFVTIGPADGTIGRYCRTIPQEGYGKIYATKLGGGFYQIANGHHRVAALRILGYTTIKIFLTK